MPEAIHARTRCEVEMYAGFYTCGGSDAVGYNRSRKIARLEDDDTNDTTVWRYWEEGKSLYVSGMLCSRYVRAKQ